MPADTPSPIRLLGDHVCNKIAAGEVIERPASVFKELVENAVDAGATRIEVDVLQGGRKAVIVTDDGSGMDRENALLSIERHATSKIRDVDDIEHIHTMGFRGEALAAISAVSRFCITTRRPEDLSGVEVRVEGGTLRSVEETGCPPGTRIEVRNLFFNVPARRKFLRTEATELANIRTLFHVFALGHPDIGLVLRVDGRELERYPPQTGLDDRIADIYGPAILDQLRPVDCLLGDLHIHGYAGVPVLHRGDRRDQVTLVNRRPATAPVLGYAIREAYRDSLPRGRFPVVFLHLDLPADWVDVNVHPTKREVRFGPSHRVRDGLLQALSQTLAGPATDAPAFGHPPAEQTEDPPVAAPPRLAPGNRQTVLPEGDSSYPPLPPRHQPPPVSSGVDSPPPPSFPEEPQDTEDPQSSWVRARIFGTVGNRYALLETPQGLVILDPSAARERILYEEARRQAEAERPASQKLLVPVTVSCDPKSARKVAEHLDAFQALGFEVEPFGGDTFMVEALPAWMGDVDPESTLKKLAEDVNLSEGTGPRSGNLRDRLARSCCQLASRRRHGYSEEELRRLVSDLARCRMPYTTPFGRPTLIQMGLKELHRKFGVSPESGPA